MSLKPRNIDFQETWQGLKETVKGVVTLGNIDRTVWNNRFSDVYSLCVAYPEPLADRLYEETRVFLEDHVACLLEKVKGPGELNLHATDDGLLERYCEAWEEFSQGMYYLNSLYLYLNLQHIRRQKVSEAEVIYGCAAAITDPNNPESVGKLEVGELGLATWEKRLLLPLWQPLGARLLAAVAAARERRAALPPLQRAPMSAREKALKMAGCSLVEARAWRRREPLELYAGLLEAPLLAAAAEHHRARAAQLLNNTTVSDYMRQVLHGLQLEINLGKEFFHKSSISKLKSCYEEHMVAAHMDFLQSECVALVHELRRDDLASMYRLLRNLPNNALKPLIDTTHDHIKAEGSEAISNLEGDLAHIQFVEAMLKIHSKYRELITEVFNGDQAFMGALDKACSAVINARRPNESSCRSPEMLAKYCDTLLRKRPAPEKGTPPSPVVALPDVDDRLAAAITVFKYVDDKDVFQKFYARALAKRLIHQLSASMDQEEAMINRLKQACGYEFTNKLHRMFTDVAVSSDLNAKFATHLRTIGPELSIGISIQVLQAGAWPLGGAATSTAPPGPAPLEHPARLFDTFYRAHFSGRRLSWLPQLCTVEVRTLYTKRPHHVMAAQTQVAALLCFETVDTVLACEVRHSIALNEETFFRHVRGLVDAGLLLVEGQGESEPELTSADDSSCMLRLNLDFSCKRTKVRVSCLPAVVHNQANRSAEQVEAEATAASVDEDRKMYLQAAIVRIMKARKVLRHNELLQEVVAQARFSFAPSVAMIKKCIEALIDKQYLERSPGQSDQYSYVA